MTTTVMYIGCITLFVLYIVTVPMAYALGRIACKSTGLLDEKQASFDEGYKIGHDTGREIGYELGLSEGFKDGYADGQASSAQCRDPKTGRFVKKGACER